MQLRQRYHNSQVIALLLKKNLVLIAKRRKEYQSQTNLHNDQYQYEQLDFKPPLERIKENGHSEKKIKSNGHFRPYDAHDKRSLMSRTKASTIFRVPRSFASPVSVLKHKKLRLSNDAKVKRWVNMGCWAVFSSVLWTEVLKSVTFQMNPVCCIAPLLYICIQAGFSALMIPTDQISLIICLSFRH